MILYHGTNSIIPFKKFNPQYDGTGIVTSRIKNGGFFFTSNKNNAKFFTEWGIIITVELDSSNVVEVDFKTLRKQQRTTNDILVVKNTLDGDILSDIYFVPYSQLYNVKILKYEYTYKLDDDFILENYVILASLDVDKTLLVTYQDKDKQISFNKLLTKISGLNITTICELEDIVNYCEDCNDYYIDCCSFCD